MHPWNNYFRDVFSCAESGSEQKLDNEKRHVYNENNAMMRRVRYETSTERGRRWKCPVGKYLKTTSEWL